MKYRIEAEATPEEVAELLRLLGENAIKTTVNMVNEPITNTGTLPWQSQWAEYWRKYGTWS